MPITGDWKKQFSAAAEMVAHSKAATLKLCSENILRLARTDSIIQGGTKVVQKKRGGTFVLYLEHAQADRWSRPNRKFKNARRIFNNAKFFSRTGNLEKALTPAGGWSGNTLSTRGEGKVIINEKEGSATIRFEGNAAGALSGADSKKGRNSKVELTDREGNVHIQNERGRRRIIENASSKTSRLFSKIMQQELDKRTRSVS